MFYSILLVGAVAAILYVLNRWKHLPAEQRQDFALRAALWSAALIVIALVLAGRAHWLMGVLAAVAALAARAVQIAQYVPIFRQLFGEIKQEDAQKTSPPVYSHGMSRRDAADILGINEDASTEEVRLAHKKLMQKMHPDRGGTDALASQINRAKEVLLG